jgi:ribosomal protein S4
MATRTTLVRMKMIRKFGQPFWPWRRMNSKQVKIVAKVSKKTMRQAKGQDMKRKKSQFFHHIRARKLMALLYGKLHTSYLLTLFKKSSLRRGKTISNFFAALETRLDTTLYRVQFAPTFQAARQLITHHKICVNNVIITKPGYILQPGDVISIAPNDVAFVGQSIQDFLRAGNTRHALRTVGLLRKFRATRRRRNQTTKKMGIAPKKMGATPKKRIITLPKHAIRVIRELKYKKARKTNTQRKVHFTKHTGTSNTSTAQKITLTKIKRAQMLLKMRRHMMQTKRNKRLTLRVTKNCLKRIDAQHLPYSLLTKRPRKHTRLRMVRFQRTAKGMPVKAWVNTVFNKMPVRT